MVDFFMSGYAHIRNILGIRCSLVGVFVPIIIFFISCLAPSESTATLGQTISQTEVYGKIIKFGKYVQMFSDNRK